MIPGHYIIGKETYDIFFDFLKDSERNFNFETKISNFFNFWLQNWAFFIIFSTKNWKCWKFWSHTWNFILNLLKSVERCYNFHFLWYSDQESWSRTQILVNIRKCFFTFPKICIFSIIHILCDIICCLRSQHMLTKIQNVKVWTLSFL